MALDEPVRRYLDHALGAAAQGSSSARLTMSGRIRAGVWPPFSAAEECDGRSFAWRSLVPQPIA